MIKQQLKRQRGVVVEKTYKVSLTRRGHVKVITSHKPIRSPVKRFKINDQSIPNRSTTPTPKSPIAVGRKTMVFHLLT
jgi:hypothetical protein